MKNILRPKSAKISTRSVPLEATADNNNNKDKKAEIDMDFIEKADNKQLKVRMVIVVCLWISLTIV